MTFYSGAISGIVSGLPSGLFAATTATVLSFITLSDYRKVYSFTAFGAAVVGLPVSIVCASIGGLVFSPIFTLSSVKRIYKNDTEINLAVERLAALHDTENQQYIIDKILDKDNGLDWGFRSIESLVLKQILDYENYSVEEKWKSLIEYMTIKTYSKAYANNGKKLFNAILSVTLENDFILRLSFEISLRTNDLKSASEIIQQHPAFLTKLDKQGKNFLHRAVMNNDIKSVAALINLHCKTNKPVTDPFHIDHKKTALELAAEHGHTEITLLLIKADEKTSKLHPLLIAIKNSHLETVKALIETYPELLNASDRFQQTALHYAAGSGHYDLVKYLHQAGADINLETKTFKTPLHYASYLGHTAIANYLVNQAGAIDHEVNQLKYELRILLNIIHHPDWVKQGQGFFGYTCIPNGVKWLRKNIPSNIYTISDRDSILELAKNLREHHFGVSNNRCGKSAILYNIIENLGQNRASDFNYLANFITPVESVNQEIISLKRTL